LFWLFSLISKIIAGKEKILLLDIYTECDSISPYLSVVLCLIFIKSTTFWHSRLGLCNLSYYYDQILDSVTWCRTVGTIIAIVFVQYWSLKNTISIGSAQSRFSQMLHQPSRSGACIYVAGSNHQGRLAALAMALTYI
jgi:hypothetical protein